MKSSSERMVEDHDVQLTLGVGKCEYTLCMGKQRPLPHLDKQTLRCPIIMRARPPCPCTNSHKYTPVVWRPPQVPCARTLMMQSSGWRGHRSVTGGMCSLKCGEVQDDVVAVDLFFARSFPQTCIQALPRRGVRRFTPVAQRHPSAPPAPPPPAPPTCMRATAGASWVVDSTRRSQ